MRPGVVVAKLFSCFLGLNKTHLQSLCLLTLPRYGDSENTFLSMGLPHFFAGYDKFW